MKKYLLKLSKLLPYLLVFAVFGCTTHYYTSGRYYVPKPMPVKPEMVEAPAAFVVSKDITVSNSQIRKKTYGGEYFHEWTVNLSYWTDTAVELAKAELEKRISSCGEDRQKTLVLSVTRANHVWETREITCNLTLHVETGNGYQKSYEVIGASPNLFSSSDHAITLAIAAMLNDKQIRAYLAPVDSDADGICDGSDKCPDTPKGVKIDETGCPADSDGDGVPDYLDRCPETPPGVKVNAQGCPPDTDGDGVPDYKDLCPDTAPGTRVDENGCPPKPAKESFSLQDTSVFFDFDQYEIKPEFYPQLDRVAGYLQQNPKVELQLQGHTDDQGSGKYNQDLSEKRAIVVFEYLVGKGISEERLFPEGFGYSKPRSRETSELARAKNRRVDFVVLPETQ